MAARATANVQVEVDGAWDWKERRRRSGREIARLCCVYRVCVSLPLFVSGDLCNVSGA